MKLIESPTSNLGGIENLNCANLVSGKYAVDINGVTFHFMLRKDDNIQILFVLLSGAIEDSQHGYPNFQRWSWYKEFPGSVLNIADPTLLLGDLKVGWYLGPDATDYTDYMATLVAAIAKKLAIAQHRIITYGSSGGGFAAIRLANRLPASTACAINPQVNILGYYPRHRDIFINACFPVPKKLTISQKNKLSLIHDLELFENTKILYVQNINDTHHYHKHYKSLLASPVIKKHKVSVMEYEGPPQHGPETRKMVTGILEKIFEVGDITQIKNKAAKLMPSQLYFIKTPLYEDPAKDLYFLPTGRQDLEKCLVSPPFDWNANPYNDNNWLAQVQMWRMMDDPIYRYEKSKNQDWLIKPQQLISDWHSFYNDHKPNPYVWVSMNAGVRAMKLAYFCALHKSRTIIFSPQFMAVCEELIERHLEFLLNESKVSQSNHALMDIHGLAALAQVVSPIRARGIYDFIIKIFPDVLGRQFNADGIHLENSPLYHTLALSYLKRLQNTRLLQGFPFPQIRAKAEEAQAWFYLPDGRLAPIGDTDGCEPQKGGNIIQASPNGIFHKAGYAIMREKIEANESYLFFMAAYHSNTHKHSDDLSLIWYENEDILCDAGKYAYQKSPKRDYVISTRAHNTLEIDGTNTFTPNSSLNNDPGTWITDACKIKDIYYLCGQMTIKRFSVSHMRQIFLDPGKFLLIIDTVQAQKKHDYILNWHLAPEISIKQADKEKILAFLSSGTPLHISFISNVKKAQINIVAGREEPRMQGFISRNYRELTPNPCIEFSFKAKTAVVATCFGLDYECLLEMSKTHYLLAYGNKAYELPIKFI